MGGFSFVQKKVSATLLKYFKKKKYSF